MPICIRYDGDVRRTPKGDWRPVVCHAADDDAKKHLGIVEQEFEWHGGLDLDYMRSQHSDHFSQPHNVVRAILLFHYSRNHGLFFEAGRWAYGDLPERQPDNEGADFKLWVDFPEGRP